MNRWTGLTVFAFGAGFGTAVLALFATGLSPAAMRRASRMRFAICGPKWPGMKQVVSRTVSAMELPPAQAAALLERLAQ